MASNVRKLYSRIHKSASLPPYNTTRVKYNFDIKRYNAHKAFGLSIMGSLQQI